MVAAILFLFVYAMNEPCDVDASRVLTNPFCDKESVMAVYRVSEKWREPFGVDRHGWKITRLIAYYQCEYCPTIFAMQCRSESVSKSCGCKKIEVARKVSTGNTRRRTHNLSLSTTYKSWSSMKSRCSNPNNVEYHRYGGRGISVCERWNSFENFVRDMGDRPRGCSIDRIDCNGNYEPGNCKWSTDKEQASNRRTSKRLTIKGVCKTVAEWSRMPNAASDKVIYKRIYLGWSDEEAVFGRPN